MIKEKLRRNAKPGISLDS